LFFGQFFTISIAEKDLSVVAVEKGKLIPIKLNNKRRNKSNIFLFSPILDKAQKLMTDFSFHNEMEHQVHNVKLVF